MNMKKVFVICLVFIILSTGVLSQEEPSVEFTGLECNDLGVLSFKAEYEWTGYKGGYVYLKSVEIKATKDGETDIVEGYWRKFKTEMFPQSEIELNSPTAYFFSNEDSLKEGTYNIEVDYSVSRRDIERFKKKFEGSVICPKQKEVIKEEPPKKEVEEKPKEESKIVPKEPSLLSEETKGYTLYYVIGLLIVIFIVSLALMKKLPKKPHKEEKSSSKKIANLFEKKQVPKIF